MRRKGILRRSAVFMAVFYMLFVALSDLAATGASFDASGLLKARAVEIEDVAVSNEDVLQSAGWTSAGATYSSAEKTLWVRLYSGARDEIHSCQYPIIAALQYDSGCYGIDDISSVLYNKSNNGVTTATCVYKNVEAKPSNLKVYLWYVDRSRFYYSSPDTIELNKASAGVDIKDGTLLKDLPVDVQNRLKKSIHMEILGEPLSGDDNLGNTGTDYGMAGSAEWPDCIWNQLQLAEIENSSGKDDVKSFNIRFGGENVANGYLKWNGETLNLIPNKDLSAAVWYTSDETQYTVTMSETDNKLITNLKNPHWYIPWYHADDKNHAEYKQEYAESGKACKYPSDYFNKYSTGPYDYCGLLRCIQLRKRTNLYGNERSCRVCTAQDADIYVPGSGKSGDTNSGITGDPENYFYVYADDVAENLSDKDYLNAYYNETSPVRETFSRYQRGQTTVTNQYKNALMSIQSFYWYGPKSADLGTVGKEGKNITDHLLDVNGSSSKRLGTITKVTRSGTDLALNDGAFSDEYVTITQDGRVTPKKKSDESMTYSLVTSTRYSIPDPGLSVNSNTAVWSTTGLTFTEGTQSWNVSLTLTPDSNVEKGDDPVKTLTGISAVYNGSKDYTSALTDSDISNIKKATTVKGTYSDKTTATITDADIKVEQKDDVTKTQHKYTHRVTVTITASYQGQTATDDFTYTYDTTDPTYKVTIKTDPALSGHGVTQPNLEAEDVNSRSLNYISTFEGNKVTVTAYDSEDGYYKVKDLSISSGGGTATTAQFAAGKDGTYTYTYTVGKNDAVITVNYRYPKYITYGSDLSGAAMDAAKAGTRVTGEYIKKKCADSRITVGYNTGDPETVKVSDAEVKVSDAKNDSAVDSSDGSYVTYIDSFTVTYRGQSVKVGYEYIKTLKNPHKVTISGTNKDGAAVYTGGTTSGTYSGGDTVTLTVKETPSSAVAGTESFAFSKTDGTDVTKDIKLTGSGDTYSFTMPDYDVNVSVTWAAIKSISASETDIDTGTTTVTPTNFRNYLKDLKVTAQYTDSTGRNASRTLKEASAETAGYSLKLGNAAAGAKEKGYLPYTVPLTVSYGGQSTIITFTFKVQQDYTASVTSYQGGPDKTSASDVTVTPAGALHYGDNVKIAIPSGDAGHAFPAVKVYTKTAGTSVAVSQDQTSKNVYTFSMPDDDCCITVEYSKLDKISVIPGDIADDKNRSKLLSGAEVTKGDKVTAAYLRASDKRSDTRDVTGAAVSGLVQKTGTKTVSGSTATYPVTVSYTLTYGGKSTEVSKQYNYYASATVREIGKNVTPAAAYDQVDISAAAADEGDTVTVTAESSAAYAYPAVSATDGNGGAVTLTEEAGSTSEIRKYTFTMPGSGVTLNVTYKNAKIVKVTPPAKTVYDGVTVSTENLDLTGGSLELSYDGVEGTKTYDLSSEEVKLAVDQNTITGPAEKDGYNVYTVTVKVTVGSSEGKFTYTYRVRKSYSITKASSTKGVVSADALKLSTDIRDGAAVAGAEVTASALLDPSYKGTYCDPVITVRDASGNAVKLQDTGAPENESYGHEMSFVMPASDVTVSVAYQTITGVSITDTLKADEKGNKVLSLKETDPNLSVLTQEGVIERAGLSAVASYDGLAQVDVSSRLAVIQGKKTSVSTEKDGIETTVYTVPVTVKVSYGGKEASESFSYTYERTLDKNKAVYTVKTNVKPDKALSEVTLDRENANSGQGINVVVMASKTNTYRDPVILVSADASSDASGKILPGYAISYTQNADGSVSFIQRDRNVTVTVTYKAIDGLQIEMNEKQFADKDLAVAPNPDEVRNALRVYAVYDGETQYDVTSEADIIFTSEEGKTSEDKERDYVLHPVKYTVDASYEEDTYDAIKAETKEFTIIYHTIRQHDPDDPDDIRTLESISVSCSIPDDKIFESQPSIDDLLEYITVTGKYSKAPVEAELDKDDLDFDLAYGKDSATASEGKINHNVPFAITATLYGNLEGTYDSSKDASGAVSVQYSEDDTALAHVKELIDAIGTVTNDQASKDRIDAARKAYDALTVEGQQDQLSTGAYLSTLTNAEDTYAKLKDAADQKDDSTTQQPEATTEVPKAPDSGAQSGSPFTKSASDVKNPAKVLQFRVNTYSETKIYVVKGKTYKFGIKLRPNKPMTDDEIVYQSSNPAVAEAVKTGTDTWTLRAVGTGKAVITVMSVTGKKDTISVTVVNKAKKCTRLKIRAPRKLKKGKTVRIRLGVNSASVTGTARYSVNNRKIASVTKYGYITGKKKGRVKVTVRLGNRKATRTIMVR